MLRASTPVFLAFFLMTSALLRAEGPALEYRVTDIEGPAGIIPKNSKNASPAVAGLMLLPGDRLITGVKGRVELASKAGTVIELKEKASLIVEMLGEASSTFFLKKGRLFARFASLKKRVGSPYRIKTPVMVASVRGTELGVSVKEDGETDAGVVEGTVGFTSLDKPEAEEVVVEKSQGVHAAPHEAIAKLPEIPKPILDSIDTFQHIRDRVPQLRDEWKDLDKPSQMKMRQDALRERVKWEVPEKLDIKKPAPPPKP